MRRPSQPNICSPILVWEELRFRKKPVEDYAEMVGYCVSVYCNGCDGTRSISGLADVPGSHLTRVELVIDALIASWPPLACSQERRDEHYKIDALIGRRGGAHAEMGLAEVFT